VSVLGTGAEDPFRSPFQWLQESAEPPYIREAIPVFTRFSPLRHSPDFNG